MSVKSADESVDGVDLSVADASSLSAMAAKSGRRVLNEEKYVHTIERIIERDFFPDLVRLRAQVEYRNAVEANDFEAIKSMESKFRATSRPTTGLPFNGEPNTPNTFETPVRRVDTEAAERGSNAADQTADKTNGDNNTETFGLKSSDGNEERSGPKEMGLDCFLNEFTSEDNASFGQIREEELRKHRFKYPWLYQDVSAHNRAVQQLLELPPIERQAVDTGNKSAGLITWPFANANSVMYNPEGAPYTDEEKLANIKCQQVVHENTRFKTMPFNESLNKRAIATAAQLQAKQKEGKIGVDGKELLPKDTPQVNGFKLVSMTPSPRPGVAESPFMTWGEIEGTPFSLDGSDTPLHPSFTPGSAQFKIPDLPQRDLIGLSLANKAAKQHRDNKKNAVQRVHTSLESPAFGSPKTPIERLNSMSPAAQRLAKTKLGLHRNTDRTLLASYSPARHRVRTPGSTPDSACDSPATPSHHKYANVSDKRHSENALLSEEFSSVSKRKKALEFF